MHAVAPLQAVPYLLHERLSAHRTRPAGLPRGGGEWAVRTAVVVCIAVPAGLILGAPLIGSMALMWKHVAWARALPVALGVVFALSDAFRLPCSAYIS